MGRRDWWIWGAALILGVLTAGCAGTGSGQNQWNLAADFSTVSNPAGPWSYGQQLSGAFTLESALGYNLGPAWGGVISVNKTGTTVDGIAPNEADLDAAATTPDARWTAPYAGVFNINVSIGSTAITSTGTGNEVLINGVSQSESSFTNNVQTFTLANIQLSRGETVDVIVGQVSTGGNTRVAFTVAAA
jgi:hypothetical protein